VTNAYWFTYSGGDGFWTAQHPTEPHIIFGESQGGNIQRWDTRNGTTTSLVKPTWRPRYAMYEDSILVTRGDSRTPATKDQQARIAQYRSTQKADSAELDVRFNWETPYFLSPHNADVLYCGGNRVLKSTQRGDNLYPISPDLSKKQLAKIDTSMNKTGGITLDATGCRDVRDRCGARESYVRPGFLAPARTMATSGRRRTTARRGSRSRRAASRARRRRRVREPHRAVALRLAHLLHHVRQPPLERLHAVRLRDERLREDVPVDREQPAEGERRGLRAHGARRPVQPRPAVRRARRARCTRRSTAGRAGSGSWPACRRCRCTTSRFTRAIAS
jgi:hypothetical protein